MGDTITFAPNTAGNPTFVGRGSKIEHPDILPIFRGSYWPGAGDLTVSGVVGSLQAMTTGAYLQGLTQYGYSGSASVRGPVVDQSPWNIALPVPAPGVKQSDTIGTAVHDYIEGLLNDDRIDNVDDNHELIVLVFLDPTVPVATNTDTAGATSYVDGSNTWVDDFSFLDDNTRFEWCWVNTASNSLTRVSEITSHELVESITDPFGSGWHQTQPVPGSGAGQIGDVCNQPARSGGVAVRAYWSKADQKCIVPSPGIRRVWLSSSLEVHEPHDGPQQEGYVDLPVICGGGGRYDYVERTYRNTLRIRAQLQGFESPQGVYTINGTTVPLGASAMDLPASWDHPRSNRLFPDLYRDPLTATLLTWVPSPAGEELLVSVGPDAGNVDFTVTARVIESFDGPGAGGGSTQRTASLDVVLTDQEIVWGSSYQQAMKNCYHLEHLTDHMAEVLGPPQPGDPSELHGLVERALREQGDNRRDQLLNVAELTARSRPEVSTALIELARRVGP